MKKLARGLSHILSWIWSFLPNQINLYLGKVLAFLWLDIFRIRRKIIYDNISVVFPGLSEHQKREIAKKSMQNLCRSFFDILKIPSITDQWIKDNVIYHGLDHLKNVQQPGKGIFFLSLHLGSGDLASSIISRKIVPIHLITKRFKNIFLDEFWFSLRGAATTRFIDAHGKRNAFDILAAIKAGDAVIFVLDQFMGKPFGIETTFFGKTTGTAYGLAVFVKKSKVPVVPIYTFWGSEGKLHINFGERIDLSLFYGDDEDKYKRNVTNKFNSELEKIIRQYPEHWMWVHRRWKEFE